MNSIINEVKKERQKQDAKWGEQNHKPIEWVGILTEEVGEVAKEAVDFHFGDNLTDSHQCIKNYRAELIQVAAVAVAMIECLDRNK